MTHTAKTPGFDPEKVHVLRERDPERLREHFRAMLKGLVRIKTKEVIAIKPNLCAPMPAETGATTALWMIEETVAHIRRRRAKPIIVEGPSHIHDFGQVVDVTGIRQLARDLGVELIDARDGGMPLRPLKHDSSSRIYRVHMAALSADGIICLPKLKTHNRTKATLTLKGLMGVLSPADRHGFHRRGVEEDVVELYKRLRTRIRATFVDGTIAMEGHGPTQGRPVPMSVIIGGRDAVSVDAVSGMVMGFEPEEIHHIRQAHEAGLGDMQRGWIMHPDGIPLPVKAFERPRPDTGVRTQIITFPPLSKALRALRYGATGRTKPVVRREAQGRASEEVASLCPTGAISAGPTIDYPKCVGCAICTEERPDLFAPEGRRQKLARVASELTGTS